MSLLLKKKVDVVILSGGIGSRIRKISEGVPKSLIKINNKNILTYIFNEIKKYNFNKIYILTGYKSNRFVKFSKKKVNFVPIECVTEKKPMGTGGALYNLKKKNINDFILINGDTIISVNFLKLIKITKDKIGSVVLTNGYKYNSNKKLNNLLLHNNNVKFSDKPPYFMNGGVYFFKKKIFRYIRNKNFSLEDDLLKKLITEKKINGTFSDRFFLDIGTLENLRKAPKLLFKQFNRPAVFLDRDGVINYDYSYVHKYKDFILRPGVLKGLKLLQKKNFLIFIVTNQAGIAKNIFKEIDFIKLHLKFKNYLLQNDVIINDVVYCPHHKMALLKKFRINCDCRKPKNGMIREIYKNYDINRLQSFMIGDKISDEQCASKSGIYYEYSKKNFYLQIKHILKKIL